MKRFFWGACFIFMLSMAFAEETLTDENFEHQKDYSFIVFPGTLQLFTMEQMDVSYHSASRLINRGMERVLDDVYIWKIPVSSLVNYTWPSLVHAITHEEGHRSILTNQGIGAISQPFFNAHGEASVNGVTDSTLSSFRERDTVSFVRMFTAGIESDYLLARRGERMAAFGLESVSILHPDFVTRMVSVFGYFEIPALYMAADDGLGLYQKFASLYTMAEEENELERDICGIDVFGAVHWLFSPDAAYKRYVQWDDLSAEEKDFLFYRVSTRGFLNLVSPFIAAVPYFSIGDHIKLMGSMGYALAPFGDFIDENVYFSYDDLHFAAYVREYENYDTWFPAFGIGMYDFKPVDWLSFSLETHFWLQPENLDFYARTGVPGGAAKLTMEVFLPQWQDARMQVGLFTSVMYKTAGFLPEVESHDDGFQITFGLSFRF